VGTSVGDTDATAVAAAAVPSCCGLVATTVSRGSSPVAALLATAYGALREHRLVVTGTPDLSAFTGARAGTSGVTLRTRKHEGEHRPSKFRARAGSTAHLKLEKPHFLFLEGSEGATIVLVGVAAALAGASAALADPSTDVPAAGASAPTTGTYPRPPPRPVATGAGDSTSQGGAPVTLLFLLRRRR
jgi:hypothetical protein